MAFFCNRGLVAYIFCNTRLVASFTSPIFCNIGVVAEGIFATRMLLQKNYSKDVVAGHAWDMRHTLKAADTRCWISRLFTSFSRLISCSLIFCNSAFVAKLHCNKIFVTKVSLTFSLYFRNKTFVAKIATSEASSLHLHTCNKNFVAKKILFSLLLQ